MSSDRVAYIMFGVIGVVVGAVLVNASSGTTYSGEIASPAGYITGWLMVWAGSLAVLAGVIATGVLVGLKELRASDDAAKVKSAE